MWRPRLDGEYNKFVILVVKFVIIREIKNSCKFVYLKIENWKLKIENYYYCLPRLLLTQVKQQSSLSLSRRAYCLPRVSNKWSPHRRPAGEAGLLLTQGKQRLFFYMDYYTIALKKLIFTFLIYIFGLQFLIFYYHSGFRAKIRDF